MKRLLGILPLVLIVLPALTRADDYVDDVYYSPEVILESSNSEADRMQPYYNKKAMQEIVFYEDSLPANQQPAMQTEQSLPANKEQQQANPQQPTQH